MNPPEAAEPVPTAQLDPSAPRPLVSMEGFARFEQRARQRRIEKRLEAARQAIRSGRLSDARAAIAEVRELDPLHPALAPLEADVQAAARPTRSVRAAAPRVAAILSFATILLGASWLGSTGFLQSYPMLPTTVLTTAPVAALSSSEIAVDVQAATATSEESFVQDITDVMPPAPVERQTVAAAPETGVRFTPRVPELTASQEVATTGVVELPPPPPVVSPAIATVIPTVGASAEPPAAAPTAAAAMPAAIDDGEQVRAALRRYQAAYERLDARMAHDVWPTVDRAALARAFDSLESQTLRFDDCDVQLRGATATATCRGSARYVPKVGSREPRVESRVWNFTLRRFATDWEIETARADR